MKTRARLQTVRSVGAGVLLLAASVLRGEAPVVYTLSCSPSEPGAVRVELAVPVGSMPATLVIPRAIPMGYGEAPYDRYVSEVRAFSAGGTPLEVERRDGPRWRIRGTEPVRRLSYRVDLSRMEKEIRAASDSSKARPGYAGVLGYSVFGFVEGFEGRATELVVRAPEDWPVFSTLAPEAPPQHGSLRASAADYYQLADSQIAMGPKIEVRRLEARVPLFFVSYTEASSDLDLTAKLSREALDAVADYFGSTPFPHYTVYEEILQPIDAEHDYGFSMEHLDSCTVFMAAENGLSAESTNGYAGRARYGFAHHIAHAWIPKRSYGEGYFPFSWELAPVLDTIWFSEGFAQYAAIVALAQGRSDAAAYRSDLLQRRFQSVLDEAPDVIRRMSTVELSRVASTRYASDFRTGANSFARGGLMAAEMDDLIAAKTGGRKSLRDALRGLVAWSGRERRGFRVEELPGLLAQDTGVDVRAVFDRWLAPPAGSAR